MRKLFIILLSVLSLTTFAQQKKVAVYVTGEQNGISKVLGDKLVEAFTNNGKYIAVERTSSFLAQLNKEQNYQRTGAVDDNDISRLGKQFGVQLVCVTDISEVFGEKYISARLIDVETTEVVNATNTNSPLSNMDELLTMVDKIAIELTGKTGKEKAAEAAAKEETDKMFRDAFSNGYIKIDNLYVTTSFPKASWDETARLAAECYTGGLGNWRLPTFSEFRRIYENLKEYYQKRNEYSKEASNNIETIYQYKYGHDGFLGMTRWYWIDLFWEASGGVCYGPTGYVELPNRSYLTLEDVKLLKGDIVTQVKLYRINLMLVHNVQ